MPARRAKGAAGPDRAGLERAFELFLKAARVPLDDPELADTPARAAAAWADEFLDGYRTSPEEAFGELSPAPRGGGLVLVTHVDYTGVCPHHLLPYRGVAHVAYRPRAHVAGFGRVAVLVDALAHRLLLQETLAREIAEAFVGVVGAKGAAVVLDAEQSCMSMRGEKRAHSRAAVEATAGRIDESDVARLWSTSRARRPRKRGARS